MTINALEMKQKPKGFTLIELLIVVALVAILGAIAVPSYSEYVTRANRVDAQDKLAEIMFEQERYQLRRRTYTVNLTDLGYDQANGLSSKDGHYLVTAAVCPGINIRNCVLLTANPTPGGRQDQPNELPLSLDSRGQRTGKWKR